MIKGRGDIKHIKNKHDYRVQAKQFGTLNKVQNEAINKNHKRNSSNTKRIILFLLLFVI